MKKEFPGHTYQQNLAELGRRVRSQSRMVLIVVGENDGMMRKMVNGLEMVNDLEMY